MNKKASETIFRSQKSGMKLFCFANIRAELGYSHKKRKSRKTKRMISTLNESDSKAQVQNIMRNVYK